MKGGVGVHPVVAEPAGILRRCAGCALQGVVGADYTDLPRHVPPLNRVTQRTSLYVDPNRGEITQILNGDRNHLESDLRFSAYEPLLRQPA